MRVKNNPEIVLGQPVETVADYDWDECFPAVKNGHIVGVVSAFGGSLAGDIDGTEYSVENDWYE